ncbi:MAG: cell division protein ZipA [Oceanospirillaceae bacterium]|nr:cell division protein ZipA [Oceanospirillaceae bacterium]
MEVGLREWLIVGAIIVIVLIIVDGWRRMRAQSNTLKIDIDEKLSELGAQTFNPELPLGSVRVFKAKETADNGKQSSTTQKPVDKFVARQASVKSKQVVEKTQFAENQKKQLSAQQNVEINIDPIPVSKLLSEKKRERIEPVLGMNIDGPDHQTEVLPPVNVDEADTAAPIAANLTTAQVIAADPIAIPDIIEQAPQAKQFEPAVAPFVSAESATVDSGVPSEESVEFEDSMPDVQSSVVAAPNRLARSEADESFTVPDILKKKEANSAPEVAETVSQQTIDSSSELVKSSEPESIPAAVSQDKAETPLERVSKEETDQIVNNLLHTFAQSKKSTATIDPVPSSEPAVTESGNGGLTYRDRVLGNSSNILGADKFEQLLAEQNLDRVNLSAIIHAESQEKAQAEQAENDIAAKQLEIDDLKARLKEISDRESEDKAKGESESEYFAPTDNSEALSSETDTQRALTTVIDDDVSLEDIDGDVRQMTADLDLALTNAAQPAPATVATIMQVPELVEPEPEAVTSIEPQLTAAALTPQPQPVITERAPVELELEPTDAELAEAARKLSQHNQSIAAEITEQSAIELEPEQTQSQVSPQPVTELQPPEDFAAFDPLMDGYQDESSSEHLIEQFEADLVVDQQAVANELDMPITEILKKQQSATAQSATGRVTDVTQDSIEEDPLLSENQLSESLLSGADFDEDQQLAPNSSETDDADNLGFNALTQDFSADPLMDGIVEQPAAQQNESRLISSEAEPRVAEPGEVQQKSFFDEAEDQSTSKAPAAPKKPRKAIANVDDPNAVLIITVVAKEEYLNGAVLRQVVEACGMEFGYMDVFHRFEDGLDEGAVQFSMANAINPGTFDIDTMDDTATPGVSFFMSMDEPVDPKRALECMLATAETVAMHLHGDLLDDDRSVLRPQTKEHYKERVRIHEMNKLRRRAQ